MIGKMVLGAAAAAGVKWSRQHPIRLVRLRDVSGVSGTGLVADGWVLPLGAGVVLRWRQPTFGLSWYQSVGWVEKIHGHSGATLVEVGPPKPYQWSATAPAGAFDCQPFVDIVHARLTGAETTLHGPPATQPGWPGTTR